MNMTLTLDVAISLMFIYVLAALLASTLNETIAGMLKLRGVYLTKAIETLTSLGIGNEFTWGGFSGWFYAYFRQSTPTVSANVDNAAVASMKAAEAAAAMTGANAADVATAAMGVPHFNELVGLRARITAAAAAVDATAQSVLKVIRPIGAIADLQSHPLLVGTPSSLPSYVPARDFATALLSVLNGDADAPAFAQVQTTIHTLPEGDLKTTLLAFIQAGACDLDTLRTRIENWFDDSMERLSGIYTRFCQYAMLILGLLIAVGMNIDSIHLAKILWDQPALSKALSDGATQFVTDHKNDLFGCNNSRATNAAAGAGSPTGAQLCQPMRLVAIQNVMDQQNLPIGRKGVDFFGCTLVTQSDGSLESDIACAGGTWKCWTAVGWIVSAMAISLGAQFWFGLLSQLINLRAAGDKPDRANASPDAAT